jgi:hypothetical protein
VSSTRLFRRDIERILHAVAMLAPMGAIVVSTGWGYEQRHQTRTWRQAACTDRLREMARGTSFLVNVDHPRDACDTLRQLGLDLETGP